jgi:hypothetical protein
LVEQIGDGTWGLFPYQVKLHGGETYTARLRSGVCDLSGSCTRQDLVWKFTVAKDDEQGRGDTSIPMGFKLPVQGSNGSLPDPSPASHRGNPHRGAM